MIVPFTATVPDVALEFVLHHLFVNPDLVILGAVTVQLVAQLDALVQYALQLSLSFHRLSAPFLLYVIVNSL